MPHKGVCVGGPMAGLTIHTRSDTGFLAVDRQAGAAWAYYADTNGRFLLDLSPDPSLLDDDGTRVLQPARLEGAGEKCIDVVAVPGEPGEPDEVNEPAEADLGPDPEPVQIVEDEQGGS